MTLSEQIVRLIENDYDELHAQLRDEFGPH
jgi:hypothetical protein